jgi:hypothetical protein
MKVTYLHIAAASKITKQETLEEAAKDFIENTMKYSFNSLETKTFANRLLKSVEFGAKWQAERMYSEDKVIILLNKFGEKVYGNYTRNQTMEDFTEEWFEQHKKK